MASYTPAQKALLKSFILADPTLSVLATNGDYNGVADGLNAAAAGPYVVWKSTVPASTIANCVDIKSYTPTDNPPPSPSTDMTYQNRALQCQLKQGNFFGFMALCQGTVVSSFTKNRQTLQDALTNVPSGANGALIDAGWAGAGGVRLTMQRNASVAEKVLTGPGTGTQASPADIGWEGTVSVFDINFILS